jgi:N-acetylneuraminic acid mutarotase
MSKIIPFMLIFFFIIGSFVVAFSSVSAPELVENSWNTKEPMSQARAGLGVVAVDGKIYAIGGIADGHVLAGTNECYDPVSDKWVTLEPMPTPRAYFAIAVYQNKIYCIGGTTYNERGTWDICAVNEVYDPITNSWSNKTSFPYAARWLHAQTMDGQIFVMDSTKLFVYDPIKDTWFTKTNMPVIPASDLVTVGISDKIMVTCRCLAGVAVEQKVMIYDTKTDKWNERENGPTRIDDGIAGEMTTGLYTPKRVYVFFGDLDTLVYDTSDDSWSSAKAMPTNRRHFGVAVVDDIFYIIGGFHFNNPSAANDQYIPVEYSSSYVTPEPSDSLVTSEPEPSTPSLTFLVVVALIIIAGVGVTGLFFYVNKKKDGMREKRPF